MPLQSNTSGRPELPPGLAPGVAHVVPLRRGEFVRGMGLGRGCMALEIFNLDRVRI